jgi:predicted SprT family Zn-dependent metalloprotease
MHSLEEVRAEYERLDRLIGVDTRGIELKISKRAVRQLGSFRAPSGRGTPPRITLSALILDDDAAFWDTIRHEYAHAAVWLLHPRERHGHDRVWKDMCRRVGCRPRRLAASDGKAAALREERVRYIVRCDCCGAESRYIRRGRVVNLVRQGKGRYLRCSNCGRSRFSLQILEREKKARTE